MCVILYSVRPLDGGELAAAIRRNPDGLAFSTWGEGGWSVPFKAAPDEGDGAAYREAVSRLSAEGLPAGSVFWSRIATGSRCDLHNCQPFPVCRGRGWLWHNGIIGESLPSESDTRRLAAILADTTPARADWLLDILARGGAGRFLVQWAGDASPALYGRWEASDDGETVRSNRGHLYSPRAVQAVFGDEWGETAGGYVATRHGGRFAGEVIRGMEWRRK